MADRSTTAPVVVLASSSPRRLELLRRLGLQPVVRAPDVDERRLDGEGVERYARRLAHAKAAAVPVSPRALVVAADTVVAVDGDDLGKPSDDVSAWRMLRRLSGRTHEVVTGVALRRDDVVVVDAEVTQVTMRPLPEAEIAWYVRTREPRGKAGGYAIQGTGEVLVERIAGSHSAVVGLPLARVVALARLLGVGLVGVDGPRP